MEELDHSLHSSNQIKEDFLTTIENFDEEPLIVSDDPYVKNILPDSKDPNYAPQDRFNLGFILMVLLGMGTSYPWSFFVTATAYFQYSFRNVTNPDQSTQYQNFFENSLAVVSTTCGFVGLFLSTILTRFVGFRYRIFSGYLTIVAVFLFTTILAMRNTDSWQGGFFLVTMLNVLLINLANSLVSGGLFGIQGCLPSRFSTAMMIGHPLAGMMVAFAVILSIICGEDSASMKVRKNATFYFASAIGATVLCILAFVIFLRLPVIRYYLDDKKKDFSKIEEIDRKLDSSESEESTSSLKKNFPMKLVFSRTWKTGLALILNVFVTISVFPALTTAVRSLNSSNNSLMTNQLFLPIACFVVMNFGDLCGRLAHGFLQFPRPKNDFSTLILSFFRLFLIVIFLFCNAQPRKHLPVIFGDASYVSLIAILAFSNGYICNLGMMYGPKLVPPNFAETTGSLMGLCLFLGLWTGSIFSFALVYFL